MAYLAAARAVGIGVCILGRQVDSRALAGSRMPGSSLIQRQLLCNGCEELPDVLSRLGRGFEEEETGFPGVGFGVGSRDRALVRLFCDQIELVAGKSDDDVFVCLALELLNPGLGLV